MPVIKKLKKSYDISLPKHPRNILPESNFLLASQKTRQEAINSRNKGLGLFSNWNDELILYFLSEYLDLKSLLSVTQCSYYFYLLATLDSSWKPRVIQQNISISTFNGKWRGTLLGKQLQDIPLDRPPVFSDALYYPFAFANLNLSMAPWVTDAVETVPRLDYSKDLELCHEYMQKNRPFILQNAMEDWPARKKWNAEFLAQSFGDQKFKVDAVDLTISEFTKLTSVKTTEAIDENPPYLFSPIGDSLSEDYMLPKPFAEDLFSLMSQNMRPDYRWIIIGKTGSGSSMHIDPNGTSAFNAVIKGRKKWILFPPNVTPPGVIVSSDESEVTSTVSVVEWFFHYYSYLQNQSSQQHSEAICDEGEILFVPSGWWHCVLNIPQHQNLEKHDFLHIALTQNFVNRYNLSRVQSFLDQKPDQISGIKNITQEEFTHEFKQMIKANFANLVNDTVRKPVSALFKSDTRNASFKFQF